MCIELQLTLNFQNIWSNYTINLLKEFIQTKGIRKHFLFSLYNYEIVGKIVHYLSFLNDNLRKSIDIDIK